jgi:hypothetical protein
MKRTLLAIGLVLSVGVAHAGGIANRNNTSTECPNKGAEKAPAADVDDAANTASTATRPAKSTRAGGGGTASTKLVSPRWHSLLPGMFR